MASTGDRGSGRWWLASVLLVAAGAVASAYLLARSFALVASPEPAVPDLCAVLLSTSCDPALADPGSWILGIPIAGWGLVFFATLGALLSLARFLETFAAEALLAGLLVSAAGALVCLTLSIQLLLGPHPFCPLCAIVHAIVVPLPLTVHRASARPVREQLRRLGAAAQWLLRSGAATAEERWKLLGFGSAALTAAFAFQWVYVESVLRRPPAVPAASPAQVIAAYDAT
ncbi:MAG: vitamin K epoxide reductase family protein, partial [bacterium]